MEAELWPRSGIQWVCVWIRQGQCSLQTNTITESAKYRLRQVWRPIFLFEFAINNESLFTGVVSTWAGSGNPAMSNGIGLSASFLYPAGVSVDSLGAVFVADQHNHRIRRISITGERMCISFFLKIA